PLSPSRSSIASREPVDAPEGTAARPITPLSSSTSHSTVGLPRLSRISRPTISTMALIHTPFPGLRILEKSRESESRRTAFPGGGALSIRASAAEIVLEQRLRLHDAVDAHELLEERR